MKTEQKNNSGFTLIETFVAVTVLMIAVLGPMTLLSRALVYSNQIKNGITAGYLAQEGIEVVINRRDINPGSLAAGEYCVDSKETDPLITKQASDYCQVKTDEAGYYGNSSAGSNTIFTRIVKITSGTESDSWEIISTVAWPEKGGAKSLSSVSYIYN